MAETTAVNTELVGYLKRALALAESGKITVGAIVAFGPQIFHVSHSAPRPVDAVRLIGELGIYRTNVEVSVINDRAEQVQRQPGIMRPNGPMAS